MQALSSILKFKSLTVVSDEEPAAGKGGPMAGAFAAMTLLCAWAGGSLPQHTWVATAPDATAWDVTTLVREELTPRLSATSVGQLAGLPLVVSVQQLPATETAQRAGKAFSVAYLVPRAGRDAQLSLRAGYRYGLPLDVPELNVDDTLVLSSGGTLRVSVGTVGYLQVDLEAFRELAGARVLRLDAVPGFRVRLNDALPFEAGAGLVVSTKTEKGAVLNHTAGMAQVGGRF